MVDLLFMLAVVALAGLLAGGGNPGFLAAAGAATAAIWVRRHLSRADRLYVRLDPLAPDGAVMVEAFREALDRVRQSPRPVRLRINAFHSGRQAPFRLEIDATGDVMLLGGPRRQRLSQPGVWLADHPLPLVLPSQRSLTLRFERAGASRVRVFEEGLNAPSAELAPLLAALAATACFFDTATGLAAVLGFAFQTYRPDLENRSRNVRKRIRAFKAADRLQSK